MTQCVWFDSNSSPITLDETEEASRIYAVINSESRGTVLQYRRGKVSNHQTRIHGLTPCLGLYWCDFHKNCLGSFYCV